MALTNPNDIVTEERLSEFYQGILPYLGAVHGSPPKPVVVYGMRILRDESVPSDKVVYLEDAVGMTPAHMDYTNNVFDYGSWEDAFFMPKPCMLKYDGTVDYYLDPNDYTKKEDGTASDVADTSYGGNAMMEWPKIWLKIIPDATKDNKEADIFISNKQVDTDYHDWPYHNSLGESVSHFYTAIYSGALINDNLRSISGQQIMTKKTAQQEYTAASNNNPSNSFIWTMEVISEIDLINILLLLIGKSTNTQATFGKGLGSNGTEAIVNAFRTGVQNDKGLFYGTSSDSASTYSNTVKIFGMENWWGFVWRRYLGEVIDKGVRKRKLTYNTEDGSTVQGYNFTGDGYVTSGVAAPSGTSGGYLTSTIFTEQGLFPAVASGTATTYYSDGLWFSNSVKVIPGHGGNATNSGLNGAFCYGLAATLDNTAWFRGACLSARPLS